MGSKKKTTPPPTPKSYLIQVYNLDGSHVEDVDAIEDATHIETRRRMFRSKEGTVYEFPIENLFFVLSKDRPQ